MGCYGIGSTRMIASLVERFHDDDGIIWPPAVAPFDVEIILLNTEDETQRGLAEELYASFQAAGYETLLEDRAERPGVKFKDADLIGIPIQLVVGRLAGEGQVEVRRRGGERSTVPVGVALAKVGELLAAG